MYSNCSDNRLFSKVLNDYHKSAGCLLGVQDVKEGVLPFILRMMCDSNYILCGDVAVIVGILPSSHKGIGAHC